MVIDAGLGLSRDIDVEDGTLLALWDINMAATSLLVLGFGAAVACIAALFGLASLVSDSETAAASGFVVLTLFVIWTIITSVFMYRDA